MEHIELIIKIVGILYTGLFTVRTFVDDYGTEYHKNIWGTIFMGVVILAAIVI
jgi:hypothetical protein